jgi:hypothetical protein
MRDTISICGDEDERVVPALGSVVRCTCVSRYWMSFRNTAPLGSSKKIVDASPYWKVYIRSFTLLYMETRPPELFKMLSSKTNLETINMLKSEPSYSRKIAEILGMNESYVSKILSQLEQLRTKGEVETG